MKRSISILLFALLALAGQAQDETLFRNARIVGAFGAPIVEWSMIGDEWVVASGGGGGILIDGFFLGGYGQSGTDWNYLVNNGNYRSDLAHGGLWLGYSHLKHKVIHPYSSIRIGWGVTDIDDLDFDDSIFVLSPDLGVELNVFRWFRVVGTVGYRFLDGINTNNNVNESDYRSITWGLTFRFGWFGNRRYDYD